MYIRQILHNHLNNYQKLFVLKGYYYYDGYDYFVKIISEAAHYDIVVGNAYCCIYAMLFNIT